MPLEPLELPSTDNPAEVLDPFISSQELTDYLGRNVTANPAALLATQMACATVRTIAEQQFSRGTATYGIDGTGTDVVLLPNLPVLTVGTVSVNGETVDDYMLAANGMLFRGTAGVDPRPVWPRGRQNVVVTADHGYDLIDIPQDVKMVALSLAARFIVQGVAVEEQLGSSRIKYAGPATDLTAGEKAILRKYRQIR